MSKPVPLAVALQYDKSAVPVPRVVAKGRGKSGEAILALAREHGVPIEENAPLAEALAQVELGDDIPEALYRGRGGSGLHPARFWEDTVGSAAATRSCASSSAASTWFMPRFRCVCANGSAFGG